MRIFSPQLVCQQVKSESTPLVNKQENKSPQDLPQLMSLSNHEFLASWRAWIYHLAYESCKYQVGNSNHESIHYQTTWRTLC